MTLTKKDVATMLVNYFQHKISLSELVSWAETMVIDANISEGEEEVIMDVLGKIGLADVKQFGLYWEDCEQILNKLGYKFEINLVKAA
jgi:hypothetical protein